MLLIEYTAQKYPFQYINKLKQYRIDLTSKLQLELLSYSSSRETALYF